MTAIFQPRSGWTDALIVNEERRRRGGRLLSVVHFPLALIKIGASMTSLPFQGSECDVNGEDQDERGRTEGFEELQTIALWVDYHLHLSAISWGGDIGFPARVESRE